MLKSALELLNLHGIHTFLYLLCPYVLYFSLFATAGELRAKTPPDPNIHLKPAEIVLNFHTTVKQIGYCALEGGYYAALLPVKLLLNRLVRCSVAMRAPSNNPKVARTKRVCQV